MNYSTFYAKLIPNGAASGTKFSISVSGITAIVDGQKTWTSGDLYFSVKPKSSGKATVTFKNDTDGSIIGTKEILVRSTTLANPTYSLTASATTVNEGGSVTFTLDTTDVLPNTNVPYTITGVSVEDISLSSLTGNFKIDSEGFAKLPITIAMDDLDEETETLTVTLNGKSISKSVSILNVINRKYNIGLYESTTATTEIDKQIVYSGTIFEVGLWSQTAELKHYGYGQASNEGFGREISDDLRYNNTFVGMGGCWFMLSTNGEAVTTGISINITNDSSVMYNARFKLKFTNLTSGISLISDEFQSGMSIPGSTVWWTSDMTGSDRTIATQVFNVGDLVRVEMIELPRVAGTIFEVAKWGNSSEINTYGYSEIGPNIFGKEIIDELTYKNKFVGLSLCHYTRLEPGASGSVGGLIISIPDDSELMLKASFKLKLTNLSTGKSIITQPLEYWTMSVAGTSVWNVDVPVVDRPLVNEIFTIGQKVQVEIIEVAGNTLDIIWANPYQGYDENTEEEWLVYGLYANDLNGGWISNTRLILPNGCVCNFLSMNVSTRVYPTRPWIELNYISGTKPTSINVNIKNLGTVTFTKDNINTTDTRLVFAATWVEGANRLKQSGASDVLTITT